MKYHKSLLFLLRISFGILFFYAGYSKIINPKWSAGGFLEGAQTLSSLYSWFALPQNIGWVNFLNEWGLLVLGTSLILGIFIRPAALFGSLLMMLYYIPELHFPYVGDHSFLVDEHIIYILVLLLLASTKAGKFWGLDALLQKKEK